jgi:hypothetical protein
MLRTLQRAVGALGDEALALIRHFVQERMTANGVFMDRSGREDIYYTSFGMLLSHVLGIHRNCEATRLWLNRVDREQLDMVHYAAYVRSRMINEWEQNKIEFLLKNIKRKAIRPLSSFEVVPNMDAESPYAQFIRYSLCEDTGNTPPTVCLKPYRIDGGGYANTRQGSPSTNATAAALMVTGQSEGYSSTRDVEWLRDEQKPNGGWCAEQNTPLPDLLSTATALFTLHCYDIKPRYSATDFIEGHWLDNGGFAATLLEDESDVEYLFYGLLALGTQREEKI